MTLTGYAKKYVQEGEFPSVLLPLENAANIRTPINYDRTTAGFEARLAAVLRRVDLRSRLRFSSGYEYRELERENAIFVEQAITGDNSFTKSNLINFRASMNWSPTVESYIRYRVSFIDDPLYAVPIRNTTTNTSLPTQMHGVQFGNTWTPSPSFFLHGMLGVEQQLELVRFRQLPGRQLRSGVYGVVLRRRRDGPYPGGLGFYSNWIDQDITLGSKSNPSTLPWEYGGRSDVINLGTTYAWTNRMTLSSTSGLRPRSERLRST